MYKEGKLLQVKDTNKFHAGKLGRFSFLGGPNEDVVVLISSRHGDCTTFFAVGKNEVLEVKDV